jgi:hypothetical protein
VRSSAGNLREAGSFVSVLALLTSGRKVAGRIDKIAETTRSGRASGRVVQYTERRVQEQEQGSSSHDQRRMDDQVEVLDRLKKKPQVVLK